MWYKFGTKSIGHVIAARKTLGSSGFVLCHREPRHCLLYWTEINFNYHVAVLAASFHARFGCFRYHRRKMRGTSCSNELRGSTVRRL